MFPFRFIENSASYTCRWKSGMLAGNKATFADSTFCWDDLKRFQIAIIGVQNDNLEMLISIRQYFYKLYLQSERMSIIDLGDIEQDQPDLSKLLHQVSQAGVLILLLGISPTQLVDITAAATAASHDISITSIAPDINADQLAAFTSNSESVLARYTALAYQTYFTDGAALKDIAKNGCEAVRLGVVRANIASTEPLLRDTHMLTVDLAAVRASDGGCSPNGLYAEELCRLAWYAGMSDSLNLAVFHDSNITTGITAALIAEALWHVIEGYAERRPELPTGENIKRFIVDRGRAGEELQFFQSSITNRWWMAIPRGSSEQVVISCTYEDYQKACESEIPNRWLFFYQKLNS